MATDGTGEFNRHCIAPFLPSWSRPQVINLSAVVLVWRDTKVAINYAKLFKVLSFQASVKCIVNTRWPKVWKKLNHYLKTLEAIGKRNVKATRKGSWKFRDDALTRRFRQQWNKDKSPGTRTSMQHRMTMTMMVNGRLFLLCWIASSLDYCRFKWFTVL